MMTVQKNNNERCRGWRIVCPSWRSHVEIYSASRRLWATISDPPLPVQTSPLMVCVGHSSADCHCRRWVRSQSTVDSAESREGGKLVWRKALGLSRTAWGWRVITDRQHQSRSVFHVALALSLKTGIMYCSWLLEQLYNTETWVF